jgi:CDP-diacylglycerol--glycerol-3-phosphate 3-phosphatidyltransferase
MNLAVALTVARIVLAPVFFLLFELAGAGSAAFLAAAWIVLLLIELTDLLDGFVARRLRQESELGKVLDPFADSVSRLTYFVALAGAAILPLWVLLILIYRDVSVAYIRVILSRNGHLMPARASGKAKAWVYAFAGIGGVAWYSVQKLGWHIGAEDVVRACLLALFVLAAAVALWSLADYFVFFARNQRRTS